MESLLISNNAQLKKVAANRKIEVQVAHRSGHRVCISYREACELLGRVIRNCDTMKVQIQSSYIIITIV